MKKIFTVLCLIFISTALLTFELSAKEAYKKAKRGAADAFAELDGGAPVSASPVKSEKPGKTSMPDIDMETAPLKGTGYGTSENAARADALSHLSQSIIANVQSETKMSQKEKDGKYSESFTNDIRVNSNVFLKGVAYTNPEKTKDGFKVTAYMTKEAVLGTLKYLISTLPDDLEALDPVKYDSVLTTVYLAYSLIFAISERDLPERNKYISILDAVKKEVEKMATHGSLFFMAKEGIKAEISISGKKYEANTKIFLKPGKYSFSVKSEGFRNLKGTVHLSKGDKRYVELVLIPDAIAKKEVYLNVISSVRVIDDIEKALLDFGIVPSQDENLPHSIVITLKGTAVTVDNFRRYTLEMDLHTFKNGKRFRITRYEHKPFFVTPETEEATIRKETAKISVQVVRKFLSSIDLNEFFAD
jgi:hypothetical protein